MKNEKAGLFFIFAAAFLLSGILLGSDILERLYFLAAGAAVLAAGVLYGRGKWRRLGNFLIGLAVFLSGAMCVHVACVYLALSDRDYIGGMPRSAAFYWGIPYLFLAAGCLAAAWFCHKKARKLSDGQE